MDRKHVGRRRFLAGAGFAVALPAFESLGAGAAVANAQETRRLLCLGNHLGFWPEGFFPKESGPDYALPTTLRPLSAYRERYTVFSHLDHGTKGGHSGVHAFLSGVRKEEAAGFPGKNQTIDQVAAAHVGSMTRFPSLNAGLGEGTSMCWTRAGVCIPPINQPSALFKGLFVESPSSGRRRQRLRLQQQASVLDAVRGSAKRFGKRLNTTDRNKLDQYLTSIRGVERRLQMSRQWLDRPKPLSPIEAVEQAERLHVEQIPLFLDLLTLALQTDSTRVATFEIPISFRTTELDVGSYHGLSHHGKAEGRLEQLAVVEHYLMTQFARLLSKLDEADILDQTAVILGSGMGNASNHSNKDLPVLLAGGGIRHRGHVVAPKPEAKRVPLCNLWLSTLQWFGLEIESFNRSTGTFSPMEIA